ncbi:MAG: hypothetical protein WCO69_01230 [Candidatus Omnitrophota bacterium]
MPRKPFNPRQHKLLIAGGVLCAGLLFYTVKCQLGIDLIPDFRWEEHFTVLNAFQKYSMTLHPKPGEVLLRASFDEALPSMPWGGVYGADRKQLKDHFVPGGIGGTKALLVEDVAAESWVKEFHHWVAVRPGEVFGFRGSTRIPGAARATLSVSLYDAGRTVIDHGYGSVSSGPDKTSQWQKLENRVTVPEGVAFIRFRLSGQGPGAVYFDDVSFWREQ